MIASPMTITTMAAVRTVKSQRRLLCLATMLVVSFTAAGCASQASGGNVPNGAVGGEFSKECGGLFKECSDKDAAKALDVSDVWCRWSGRDVIVHASVTNGFNANVKLSIVPRYFIENGGQHGAAFGSDVPMKVGAAQTKTFETNAGHPKGVPAGTPISDCKPKLQDIDIAD
jgi:hypothetical protein